MKAIFGKRKYLLMFKYYVLKEGVSKEDENKFENLIGQQMIIINNVYKCIVCIYVYLLIMIVANTHMGDAT